MKMKTKTTRKEIKRIYKNIINVGFCDMDYLLFFNYPLYYCTRAEGWAFDVHEINYNTCISTGYAPIGNIERLNYNITKFYNNLAKKALNKYNRDKAKIIINYLLQKFCKRCIQCKKNTKIKKL